MPKFPLIGPSYTSQSLNADCQSTINLYPESIESGAGNNQIVLYPAPGTKEFVEIIPPAPPAGPVGLQNVKVSITAAQLRQSAVTPIQLIPAQGPDLVIFALSAFVQYFFATKAYTIGNGGALFPVIGNGTNNADIQTSFTLTLDTLTFRATANKVYGLNALSSWQNLVPSKFTNKPLCWTDQFDPSGSTGDGTVTIHVQFFVLNVVTGQIVNGQPQRVFSTMTQMTAANYKAANTVPVQLIPAPGNANQVLIPLTGVVWHHFHTAPFTVPAFPVGGYGTVVADIIATDLFRQFDSNSFLLPADSMEQQEGQFYLTTDPAKIINQPFAWVNKTNVSADTGDTTATIYMQYLKIDISTGAILQGNGDLKNTITHLTAAQIKGADTNAPPVGPAPGANLLNVTQSAVGQYNFVSVAYGNAGILPNPRVNPGPATPPYITALVSFFTSGGAFTLWSAAQNEMLLANSVFYVPPDNIPGSEVPPAQVINQPLSWGNFGSMAGSTGDGTATINMQYVVLNTVDGSLAVNP